MNKKELLKYIVAFTIGDGHLTKTTKNTNSSYKCVQREDRKEFIDFQCNILSIFSKVTYFEDKRNNKKNISIGIRTNVNPLFTKVRSRLYRNNKRILDPHLIKLLDEEALALIYMADGYTRVIKRKNGNKYITVKISTHSYSYYDNCALRDYIKERFNINFKVQMEKDKRYSSIYHYLICRQEEAIKFLEMTNKYKLKCFEYKWKI